MKKNILVRIILLSFFIILPANAQVADAPVVAETPVAGAGEKAVQAENTYNTLESIIGTIKGVRDEMRIAEEDLKKAKTQEQKKTAEDNLNELDKRLKTLVQSFEKISTGTDGSQDEQPVRKFELESEIQELVKPLIKELKTMTEGPRQIEKLRGDLAFYEERLAVSKQAVGNVRKLIEGAENPEVRKHLEEVEKRWASREQQITNQLTVTSYQLEEKTKGKKTMLETAQETLRSFFKSRGRNLILAILALVAVILIMRLLRGWAHRYAPVKRTPATSFYFRLFDVAFFFFTFILAFAALVAVLYLAGDWVLLSVVIIFLLGLAWAAKQGIPRFWEQIKFMLNLGTVKENERIIYNGIPWKVVTLHFYSQLENPALSTGKIKLPLRNLTNLVSRPCHEDEPWFPSNVGDWVILSDGTRGEVTIQTPEMVVLNIRTSPKTYTTPEFIKMKPLNLSRGFRIKIIFGIDYAHQADCTGKIPSELADSVREGIKAEGYGENMTRMRVEFNSAGKSSLDFAIFAYFSGKVAARYGRLTRLIQRLAVDACNEHGWGIPFTAITVYTPESGHAKKFLGVNEEPENADK